MTISHVAPLSHLAQLNPEVGGAAARSQTLTQGGAGYDLLPRKSAWRQRRTKKAMPMGPTGKNKLSRATAKQGHTN